MKENNRMWIAWENQRRSIELAKKTNCSFYKIEYSGNLRYLKCIIDTTRLFIKNNSDVVIVQNPSMILATMACIYKLMSNKKVIIDRHTNFRLDEKSKFNLEYLLFMLLHKFTIKTADITIVTNEYLADLVVSMNGRPLVLPDKLPNFINTKPVKLNNCFNILFVCSYGKDEPIDEVLKAAHLIRDEKLKIYISGNHNKLEKTVKLNAPPNIVFTGYLNEEDYVNLTYAVDAVMVLTTADYCMLCGCYEAVAAGKPLITSKKDVLQDYFRGSIFVGNTSKEIAGGIKEVMMNYAKYVDNVKDLKDSIDKEWQHKYDKLEKLLM